MKDLFNDAHLEQLNASLAELPVVSHESSDNEIIEWFIKCASFSKYADFNVSDTLESILSDSSTAKYAIMKKIITADAEPDIDGAVEQYRQRNIDAAVTMGRIKSYLSSDDTNVVRVIDRVKSVFSHVSRRYDKYIDDSIDVTKYNQKACLFGARGTSIITRLQPKVLGNYYPTKNIRRIVDDKGFMTHVLGDDLPVYNHFDVIGVPKTVETARIIGRPSFTAKATQGRVGDALRRVCNSVGLLFPNAQDVHRKIVVTQSGCGTVATLDVKGGSDCLSLGIVDLFPDGRLKTDILRERAKKMRIDLDEECFMLVPAGNAYTFELETIVFYSLLLAAQGYDKLIHTEYVNTSVYGDDLIVPTQNYHKAMKFLSLFGITINEEKSYDGTEELESCGYHYRKGVSIKLPSIRSVTGLAGIFKIVNRLSEYNHYSGSTKVLWFTLISRIRPENRLWVPTHYGDVGINLNLQHKWTVKLDQLASGRWIPQFFPYRVRGKAIVGETSDGEYVTYHLMLQIAQRSPVTTKISFDKLPVRFSADEKLEACVHPSFRGAGYHNGEYPECIVLNPAKRFREYWEYVRFLPEGSIVDDEQPLNIFDNSVYHTLDRYRKAYERDAANCDKVPMSGMSILRWNETAKLRLVTKKQKEAINAYQAQLLQDELDTSLLDAVLSDTYDTSDFGEF